MHTVAGTTLPRTAYLDSIHRDFARFRDLVWRSTEPVPSCPGWSTRSLAKHLADVYWHQSFVVRTGHKPEDREHRPDFTFDEAPQRYLDASFSAITFALSPMLPASREVWTFDSMTSKVDFWYRRMAHETMIHRFDAELAQAELSEFDAALALDGCDEVLSWTHMLTDDAAAPVPDVGTASITARTPDRTVHWRLTLGPSHCAAEPATAPDPRAQVVVDAAAADLDLFLWGRMPATNPRLLVAGERVPEFLAAIKPLGA